MHVRHLCALLGLAVAACASSQPDTSPDGGAPVNLRDSDHDGISDSDEQRMAGVDTDQDVTPDYLDPDSDGDGLTDAFEAGDSALDTPPVDSDADGAADFRDTDSDDNGRPDAVDGADDLDGDGRGAYIDVDDDGDGLRDAVELAPSPGAPPDTDGDGAADFQDLDSDRDGIVDRDEGPDDYDRDGVGNFRDLDSDGDCWLDADEAGGAPARDSDGDRRPDFLDRDRDDDGVLDRAEDANCDGAHGADELDPSLGDTDGDGAPDLVERAAGTDGTDPDDNPARHGDFVFVEPYRGVQTPTEDELDFSTRLRSLDLYILLDRSQSMQAEVASVKAGLENVLRTVSCPVGGGGSPTCIPDLWAGAGTIGYQHDRGYSHVFDVQPNLSIASLDASAVSGSQNSYEPTGFALWSTITGAGSAEAAACSFTRFPLEANASCDDSPAVRAGLRTSGYPCFRESALPVVLVATDEPPIVGFPHTYTCDGTSWASVVAPAFAAAGAKLVGVVGYETDPDLRSIIDATRADLERMARDTGAVNAVTGAPLVFSSTAQGAAVEITRALTALAEGLPLDLSVRALDDPRDDTDAVEAFIERLETLQRGTAPCTGGLADIDTDQDSFRDQYVDVRTGVPVCWKLVARPNTTVPATAEPQLFKSTIEVWGDDATRLDERNVYFLVPPEPADLPLE